MNSHRNDRPDHRAWIRETAAQNRRIEHERHLRSTNSEVLTIEGLAAYLHCSVAAARAIPADRLPRRESPGRRILFLKTDVHDYLRRQERMRQGVTPDMVRQAEEAVIASSTDSGRKRPRKETRR